MVESSMAESFKACTTVEVRPLCFYILFPPFFFSFFFFFVLVSNPWPWSKALFCRGLWLRWWWWGFQFGVSRLWVCFELCFWL